MVTIATGDAWLERFAVGFGLLGWFAYEAFPYTFGPFPRPVPGHGYTRDLRLAHTGWGPLDEKA